MQLKGPQKSLLYFILLFLVVLDFAYSFLQHYSQPLDGDMSWHIVPAEVLKPVLESPLGLDVLLKNQSYPNPNRFFCHWSMKWYYETIPGYLQSFVSPIDSLYLSGAILKICIQIGLVYLLGLFISGTFRVQKLDFILAVFVVVPLFQTNGYQGYMGIIDMSPTYTFFYALPFLFLLIYSLPLLLENFTSVKPWVAGIMRVICIPLGLVCSLSGPLNPGIILITAFLLILRRFRQAYLNTPLLSPAKRVAKSIRAIPDNYWFYLMPISLFSLYSLFIGTYNSHNMALPLSEEYANLPAGLYYQVTQKLGMPVLLSSILVNLIFMKTKYNSAKANTLSGIYKWIGVFIVCYILLLPLGGYREYRPNVLRYDTILPVTFSLVFIFGSSVLYLLKCMSQRNLKVYLPSILVIILIFTYADKPQFDKNACERAALKQIASSQNTPLQLDGECKLLSWGKITDPHDSELNAEFIMMCGITGKKVLYYNK